MKNFLLGLLGAMAVGAIVIGVSQHKGTPIAQAPASPVGAASGNDHYNQEYFHNGLTANRYGTETVKTSSTSPAALAAAASGQIAIPAGVTVYNASTTAISGVNSQLFLMPLATTTAELLASGGALAGNSGICNLTAPTTTPTVTFFASSTAPSTNGFTLKLANAAVTNPQCYSFFVVSNP